jgi:hypothetical protein
MVFALATDDHTLRVFPSEIEAVAYCEGIDVEAGVWAFFDNEGQPLDAVFTKPNSRAGFVVASGTYVLRRASLAASVSLAQRLHEVRAVEGVEKLKTVADVKRFLALRSKEAP